MISCYVQSQGPRGAPGEIGPPGSPVIIPTTSFTITVLPLICTHVPNLLLKKKIFQDENKIIVLLAVVLTLVF